MNNIDVVGFYFLDLAKDYAPPPELEAFLSKGEPPIYIGFGSIVVKDREEITRTVLSAVAQSSLRAVISAGWGSLDADIMRDPDSLARAGNPDILVLGNVPHDWLFERVCAVCHHRGAGTTAIGSGCGKPTIVILFFGDQPWWGAQVHAPGAGPVPLVPKPLLPSTLAEAFRYTQCEDVKQAAERVGMMVRSEDGVGNGVDSFHRHLPLLNMRPTRYSTQTSFNDPVSGTVAPLLGIVGDLGAGVGHLLTTRPEKGVVKLVRAVPDGIRGSLEGLHQGLKNSPKMFGGTVRESGKISGFRSGMREGGKEFVQGFRDGFTDLVREPINGFKQAGVIGAVGGIVTGAMSAVLKPSAGIVALFSDPVEGAVVATRNLLVKPAKECHATRYAEGLAAFKASGEDERQWILKAFEARKGKWKGKNKAITQATCSDQFSTSTVCSCLIFFLVIALLVGC
ncbi:hypothetical protein FS749_016684 [Ceratobasidium sp. UAMH 11750]|nr:hypothetical protein FS749_016684 [Ceratobasidium sp. UAMH 11750]